MRYASVDSLDTCYGREDHWHIGRNGYNRLAQTQNGYNRHTGGRDLFGLMQLFMQGGDLPLKKWTGLSCFYLHLDRADTADGGATTGSIIEAIDIGKESRVASALVA
jgi:hypothetical protein